ncbi:MAG: fructose bisphosphate aldolase [Candidatus Nanopelagicales bacterium]|jgi:fructose-bisphosphate aldolase, class I|nr:fructose bisphosphate aldolase [Candidatus Nanopelagicales bacterium]MDP4906212.1 fructose bisphosphate aldolase [Candidatus Nanopelagicales bacterium]MDP4974078.1 fructose bisphosphate aldolase [Candidatus Nanopelagicales bacterium]MDP5094911.1 fructose bisphosphate aldolase [Candidatus Nanopelagicales bacterium]
MTNDMRTQMGSGKGFIAALDQSGGSTPKALSLYGIEESAYSGEQQMYDLVHQMRSRIMTNPAFNGDKVLAAILFEMTMDRDVEGQPTPAYLWNVKRVVPLVKVDLGLADEVDGVQVMKPMPHLDDLCARAAGKGVFGTKMRSVINAANPAGVKAVVDQQFDVALQILGHGLVPIIEPEVNIKSDDKAASEVLLRDDLLAGLDRVPEGHQVMFKLSLPSANNFYSVFINDPRVLRVVALSGGYSRDDACDMLTANHGMIASFSRALSEGLSAQQSDADFTATLQATIDEIYTASIT